MTELTRAISYDEAIRCRSPGAAWVWQFVFLLHPDFHEARPDSSFFSYSRRRETGRPLEDSEQCYPQFRAVLSSLRFARRVVVGNAMMRMRASSGKPSKNRHYLLRLPTLNFQQVLSPRIFSLSSVHIAFIQSTNSLS